MTISRFNHFFTRNGHYFLYNSLSNSFALLDKELYEALVNFDEHSDSQGIIDKDTKNLLGKMKAIDVDDDLHILKLKYYILKHRFNPHNLSLTINPTLACNFACPYCFEAEHESLYMDDRVENGIIDYITKLKEVKNLFVTWFGGEPLLAFDRIKSLSNKLLNLGLNYSSGIITNGYLLTEEKIREFEPLKIRTIQITIDGMPETHNKRRFLRGGFPTFTRIIENVKRSQVINPNIRISIRVNIDKSNEDDFAWTYNYIKSLDLPNVITYPGFVTDTKGRECNSCLLNSEEIADFLIKLYEKHNIHIPMFYPEGQVTSCTVRSANSAVIGPEGELYKCWNDVGNRDKIYGTIFGDKTNETILFRYLCSADHLNDNECDRCTFFPICNGGCPYVRIHAQEENCNFQKPCLLFKNRPNDFLWIHYLSKINKDKKPKQQPAAK